MKRFHLLSIAMGAVLMAILIGSIGPAALGRELYRLGWGLVPLILIEGVADILHTFGWRRCLPAPHRDLSVFRIFGIRLAGSAINYLTPSADLAGEVTKGTLLYLDHSGPEAAAGVMIGKLSFAVSKLLFVVGGSIIVLWGIKLPGGVWLALLTGSALLGAGILGFFAVQKYGRLGAVVRWMAARRIGGRALSVSADRLTRVDAALRRFYRENPRDLPISVLWHVFGFSCGIVQSGYFLYLATGNASPALAAGIWFLGSWFDLLSFPIPMSLGVLEASRVIVFRLLGFSSAVGLSFGVALRLEQVFWAGVGLLLYYRVVAGRRIRVTEQPSVKDN